jgi:Tc5 transposase DNA-binding domain/CENP-B N-terminal DNA-binding domain
MSSNDPSKKKRKILTWGEKKELCDFHEKNPLFTYKELGLKFEIAEATVCNIVKNKEKWLAVDPSNANKQKDKSPKYPEIENALILWINQALLANKVITGDVIIEKSKRFAELLGIDNFKGSDGWVTKFKQRHNIKQYNLHGEAGSAPSEEIIIQEKIKLREIIKEFPLDDVYNCDETGKFICEIYK